MTPVRTTRIIHRTGLAHSCLRVTRHPDQDDYVESRMATARIAKMRPQPPHAAARRGVRIRINAMYLRQCYYREKYDAKGSRY